jgi:hypothetical protein
LDKAEWLLNIGNDMRDWVEANQEVFTDSVLKILLEPFVYQKRLTGSSAAVFFGDVGASYALRILELNNTPILVGKMI